MPRGSTETPTSLIRRSDLKPVQLPSGKKQLIEAAKKDYMAERRNIRRAGLGTLTVMGGARRDGSIPIVAPRTNAERVAGQDQARRSMGNQKSERARIRRLIAEAKRAQRQRST